MVISGSPLLAVPCVRLVNYRSSTLLTSESAIAYPSCQRLGRQERFQRPEQSPRAVQRDDVAAVLDDVADEVVGERPELLFERSADAVGADGHGGYGQPARGGGFLDLPAA
jgi:hypothetical protein